MARFRLVMGLLALAGLAGPVLACPFCSSQGQPLAGEVGSADFVVLGHLTNAKQDPNDPSAGTTDLVIEAVIKPHDFLRGKKVLQIPKFLPTDKNNPDTKLMIFSTVSPKPVQFTAASIVSSATLADLSQAKFDAYRGMPIPADSKIGDYLVGAMAAREKAAPDRLRYFFDYLNSPELLISNDAMNEFAATDYKDVRAMAEKVPAETIVKWLKDPATPAFRFGLFGLLIGHAGKKSDAQVVRTLLNKPDQLYSSGVDGLVVGLIMLDKEAGWNYLMSLVKDPKKDFAVRYAGLRVMRFFWETRPDLVSHEEVLEGVKALIAQPDLADLPIEDLRKWGCYSITDYVMKYADEKSHSSIPLIRRAFLRYALSAPPGQAAAESYVARMRSTDPDRVKDVEEALRDEAPKPKPQK